jgi:hypothetical protein
MAKILLKYMPLKLIGLYDFWVAGVAKKIPPRNRETKPEGD